MSPLINILLTPEGGGFWYLQTCHIALVLIVLLQWYDAPTIFFFYLNLLLHAGGFYPCSTCIRIIQTQRPKAKQNKLYCALYPPD